MSDDTHQLSLSDQSDEPKTKKGTLSPERVQATIDRTIQNRMRLMDRYNGIALWRDADAKHPKDAVMRNGDIPSIQTLFEIKALYALIDTKIKTGKIDKDGNDVWDFEMPLKERVKLKSELMKQITALCIHFEDHNGDIFNELQRLSEHEESKKDGGIDIESLLKDAQQ